ncbi:hypothetical protein K0M31_012896 [Melipona bicolor]|uniref:Uncharacterized protein n=1 Tax=Melipona bicolor TaxID=60889 RepID=A0AA40KH28_9HYME|nr:hypothetical protein K0M31_012896 [Melipona bicolor]
MLRRWQHLARLIASNKPSDGGGGGGGGGGGKGQRKRGQSEVADCRRFPGQSENYQREITRWDGLVKRFRNPSREGDGVFRNNGLEAPAELWPSCARTRKYVVARADERGVLSLVSLWPRRGGSRGLGGGDRVKD